MKRLDLPKHQDFRTEHLCKAVAGIADQLAWPGAEIVLKALRHKRDSTNEQVASPSARTGTIALEQLVSLKRSKTRTSCEVLADFSTLYRAHDAMKG